MPSSEAGQTLILVGQGLLTLRDIDDDLRRRAGKIITARDQTSQDICMSIRQLASDEAESIGPRAQRELFEIAQLLETGKPRLPRGP